MLENLEKLKKDAGATYAALYEADGSVLERLKMMAAVLAELAELDRQPQRRRRSTARLLRSSWKKSRSICPAISTSSISTRANWPKSTIGSTRSIAFSTSTAIRWKPRWPTARRSARRSRNSNRPRTISHRCRQQLEPLLTELKQLGRS